MYNSPGIGNIRPDLECGLSVLEFVRWVEYYCGLPSPIAETETALRMVTGSRVMVLLSQQ